MSLFPTFTMPRTIAQRGTASRDPQYRRAPKWNFETGDFERDGAGRVVWADGYTAWLQWGTLATLVERYAFPSVSRRFGVELVAAMKTRPRKAAEAEIERTLTEAWQIDRRTKSVGPFSFTYRDGDSIEVDYTVTPRIGPSQALRMVL